MWYDITNGNNGTCFIHAYLNINPSLYVPTMATIILFLLISNLLMISNIWKTNNTLKTSHKPYIFQCITGLIDGCLILPLHMATQLATNKCIFIVITLSMMGYQNILDIVTIALLSLATRYYAVTSQRNLTSCKIILVFLTASIIAIISSFLLL